MGLKITKWFFEFLKFIFGGLASMLHVDFSLIAPSGGYTLSCSTYVSAVASLVGGMGSRVTGFSGCSAPVPGVPAQ